MTSETELIAWIKDQVSQILMLPVDDIKLDSNLYELGFDSQDSLTLTSGLENKIGVKFPASLVEEHKSIEKIIAFIDSTTAVET